jgi:O-antigen/teichoic acid export membrane protein
MRDSLLSHFVGGTVSIGLGKGLTMVLGLVGTMIVSRCLSEEALGQYFLILLFAEFLEQISGFGLFMALPHFITAEKDEQLLSDLVNSALVFQFCVIVVVGLFAILFHSPILALFGSAPIAGLVLFVPLMFFLRGTMRLTQSALQGFMRWSRIGTSNAITGITRFVLVITLVLALKAGILGLLAAEIGALLGGLLFAYIGIPVRKQLVIDSHALRKMLRFGFPLQFNDILTLIASRVDTLIIGVLLGPAEVAYYGIANKIPNMLNQIYITFRQVYFPLLSDLYRSGDKEKASRLLNVSIRLVAFATALGVLFTVLFGREVIILLFSERYLPSVTVFTLVMFALSLSLLDYTLGVSLVAIGDTNKPALINIADTAISLVGNLVFIPALGIAGAALADLAGRLATNPLDVFFLRRRGIEVRVVNYLMPIMNLGIHIVAIAILQPTTVMERIPFLVTFLAASLLLSVATVDEIVNLLSEFRFALQKSLLSRQAEMGDNVDRLFFVYTGHQAHQEGDTITEKPIG